ncbi:MAG TPA: SDR family oxidoreductase [Catalimonadaceae bacterium]|nr:SDR family oxidoreductase [Catalimonadaceae bacterium]
MKILITGSNGLLGQKLVAAPGMKIHTVLATGKGDCRISQLPVNTQYQNCDVTDLNDVMQVFSAFHPDVVIHSAAMTNVDDCELNPEACHLLNVVATQNVVTACNQTGSHLIHLSTDFIFDGENGPYSEDDKPNPISVYGQSKLDAEVLVKNATCSCAIVRTVLVYGISPGLSRSNIILWVRSSLEQGKQIQVVDDQFRTPTLAEDLAAGCLLIAEKKAEGIFNISGKDFLTPYQMAIETARFFNLDSSLIVKASAATFSQPAKRPPRTGFVISKAETVLGYQPHSFTEGIGILSSQL